MLAEDSESADVTAELVDVGEGTKESDYAGKDVKGKIVLVSASPGAVQDLAVGKFGAAGIVSYAQNQKNGLVGRGREFDSVGAFGDVFGAQDVCVYGVAEDGAGDARAVGARREDYAACGGEGGAACGEL